MGNGTIQYRQIDYLIFSRPLKMSLTTIVSGAPQRQGQSPFERSDVAGALRQRKW